MAQGRGTEGEEKGGRREGGGAPSGPRLRSDSRAGEKSCGEVECIKEGMLSSSWGCWEEDLGLDTDSEVQLAKTQVPVLNCELTTGGKRQGTRRKKKEESRFLNQQHQ